MHVVDALRYELRRFLACGDAVSGGHLQARSTPETHACAGFHKQQSEQQFLFAHLNKATADVGCECEQMQHARGHAVRGHKRQELQHRLLCAWHTCWTETVCLACRQVACTWASTGGGCKNTKWTPRSGAASATQSCCSGKPGRPGSAPSSACWECKIAATVPCCSTALHVASCDALTCGTIGARGGAHSVTHCPHRRLHAIAPTPLITCVPATAACEREAYGVQVTCWRVSKALQ